MGDHFRNRQHLQITAGVIVVLMRIQNVSERFVRHRSYLRQNIGVIAVKHVVDEYHAFIRRIEGNVPTLA
jgi:hypothetical protein